MKKLFLVGGPMRVGKTSVCHALKRETKALSLVCDPETLRARFEKDVRSGLRRSDRIERSLDRLPLYEILNTVKIRTDGKSIRSIAGQIALL